MSIKEIRDLIIKIWKPSIDSLKKETIRLDTIKASKCYSIAMSIVLG